MQPRTRENETSPSMSDTSRLALLDAWSLYEWFAKVPRRLDSDLSCPIAQDWSSLKRLPLMVLISDLLFVVWAPRRFVLLVSAFH